MANVITSVRGTKEHGNRQPSLVYDCLTPEEAKKFIDAFCTNDELCMVMDHCEDVRMTFDSLDNGSRIVRTVCIFIDGFEVLGSDEYAESLLESEIRDLEFIRAGVKALTGIE